MERQDMDMPFLLKYENVAWYDGGKVRILDRRVFPEVRFVECATYQEVRQAVADMVTQSTGPYAAVGMGMVLAVRQSEHLGAGEREEFLRRRRTNWHTPGRPPPTAMRSSPTGAPRRA